MSPKKNFELTQKSKAAKHYHWVVTGQMYLGVALFLSENICPKNAKFRIGASVGSLCRELGFGSSNPNYEFIWPIIFNLKHGVELWLKGIGIMDHGRYANKHDLNVLFTATIQNSGPNKEILKKLHQDTWPIIEKYYYGTYNPQRKDKRHPDKKNEIERFPEPLKQKRPGGGVYNVQDPDIWVDCGIIDSIAEDIRKIEQRFSETERLITPQKKFKY